MRKPGPATQWAWEKTRAANGSLIVLLAIARELDTNGNCVMKTAELAEITRLSERAVRNAVADLVAHGELEVLAPGAGRGHRTAYGLPGNPAESATFEPETRQNLPPSNPAESATFRERNSRSERNPAESATFETSDVFKRSTGIHLVEVKEASEKPPRPDVDRLCEHLASRIEANGSKRPNITKKWRDACRLMIDNDRRTEEQIRKAIDWSQDNEFWRANILSMPKLREKYDQLRLEATRKQNGNGRRTTTNDRVQQAIEAGKRVQAMLNGES